MYSPGVRSTDVPPFPSTLGAMRPVLILGFLALPGLAAPVLRLEGEVRGPLVLSTPNLVVEGQGAVLRGNKGHTLSLLAPGIKVRGLRVVGAGPEGDFFEPDAAIYLSGCEGCLLEDVRVEEAPAAVRLKDYPLEGLLTLALLLNPQEIHRVGLLASLKAPVLTGPMGYLVAERLGEVGPWLGFLYLAFSGLALALLGALVFARRDR